MRLESNVNIADLSIGMQWNTEEDKNKSLDFFLYRECHDDTLATHCCSLLSYSSFFFLFKLQSFRMKMKIMKSSTV